MTIHHNCPRCLKTWDEIEFPSQSCFGYGYPEPHVPDVNLESRYAVEGYAWWPRVDVSRFVVKTKVAA